ncbi:MAG: hypothetical protein H7Y07_05970 [Pyrinomonadaceae bacterium]|nr:hypothetical protein [Sphingobacteriaceae bacterium]
MGPKGPKTQAQNEASTTPGKLPARRSAQPCAPWVYFDDYRWRKRFTAICKKDDGNVIGLVFVIFCIKWIVWAIEMSIRIIDFCKTSRKVIS